MLSSLSKTISISAVCIVNKDCTVKTRYVSFPSRILFKISLIVDFNAFLQTKASSPIPELMANSLFSSPKITSPKSIHQVSSRVFFIAFKICTIPFFGSFESANPLARSLPEPVGITPKRTFSKSVIPLITSFAVPSPPTATRQISSSSMAHISPASFPACPRYSDTNT